jgi:hypothetical protein
MDASTGKTIEIAEDYFAQDTSGNVWYFGESVKNYDPETGKFLDTEGSWLAGKKGAEPGIAMMAEPKKGTTYDQENALGIAEDSATITSLNGKTTVPYGDFSNLLVTLDLNPLELFEDTNTLAAEENKYYAAGVGEVFAQTFEFDGSKYVLAETEKLVSVTPSTTQLVQAMASFGATESVTAPLTPSAPDEHASQHALAAPGHLT